MLSADNAVFMDISLLYQVVLILLALPGILYVIVLIYN